MLLQCFNVWRAVSSIGETKQVNHNEAEKSLVLHLLLQFWQGPNYRGRKNSPFGSTVWFIYLFIFGSQREFV